MKINLSTPSHTRVFTGSLMYSHLHSSIHVCQSTKSFNSWAALFHFSVSHLFQRHPNKKRRKAIPSENNWSRAFGHGVLSPSPVPLYRSPCESRKPENLSSVMLDDVRLPCFPVAGIVLLKRCSSAYSADERTWPVSSSITDGKALYSVVPQPCS